MSEEFVLGIDVDTESHDITVHLRKPLIKNEEPINKKQEEQLKSTYALIVNDLAEELNSVKEVLIQEGITYFLRVKKIAHSIEIDNQLEIDIKGLLSNYDILAHPSSSTLVSLALDTMENILSSDKNTNDDLKIKNLKNFLKELDENVLHTRSCHQSLSNLLNTYRMCIARKETVDTLLGKIKNNQVKIRLRLTLKLACSL